MTAITLSWAPRWPPLEPECLVVRGRAAKQLAHALASTPARLTAWRGLLAEDALILTGPGLPWAEGASYFGRDAGAGWLLLPTTHAPTVPAAWLERRYRAAYPTLAWPCVVLTAPLTVIPVGGAAPFDAARLEAWSAEPT